MCTLARNSWCAIAPPISAAAMLSRNDDSTNTITSSTKPPCQSAGRKRGSTSGHAALLEVPRQQRESHQQQEQVGEDHPLVPQVQRASPAMPGPSLKPVNSELVSRDDGEAGQRDLQRVVVEQRDAQQRQREQDEVDRDTGPIAGGSASAVGGRGSASGEREQRRDGCADAWRGRRRERAPRRGLRGRARARARSLPGRIAAVGAPGARPRAMSFDAASGRSCRPALLGRIADCNSASRLDRRASRGDRAGCRARSLLVRTTDELGHACRSAAAGSGGTAAHGARHDPRTIDALWP